VVRVTRGKRTRRGGLRCQTCSRPIELLAHPYTGRWCPFDPSPVNGRTYQGVNAYPRENKRTYLLEDLIFELMARHSDYTRADAEKEAYDMPWHVLHRCPNGPPAAHPDHEPATTGDPT
jgi:hypothetical protein